MTEVKKGNWWQRKTTSQKVSFIVSVLIFLISFAGFLVFMNGRAIFGDEIGDRLFGEGEPNGWVKLGKVLIDGSAKWAISLIIIFMAIVVIFIATFITHLFDNKTRKAKTISSLIRSLIKYIVIIIMICAILVVWGVDVIGIVAGVGVLTLIIGLGCQSLIQDVISGLFIVFDDYFAVGDTVIIDGFRGTIVDVGLKTTKLQDFGGNIKSITNSSIVTVVNMSRMRSVASVTSSVSYNEDVERVEALIINEIEEIKKKVPNITEGPWYKGIDAITASSIDFLVLCFVNEDNRFQVTRDLKREFYLCFKKNNVQIPYTQVTVNPEDNKKTEKATPEEVLLALKEQKKLRGIKDEDKPVKKAKKRDTVMRKMKESLDKTKKELDEE
jgi:small conductance mechanosensitive channel